MTADKFCISCFEGCTSCSTLANCISCVAGHISNSGFCKECNTKFCKYCKSKFECFECNDGYFLDPEGYCLICSIGFVNCLSSNHCLKCKDGFILDDLSCKKCPNFCLDCINSEECSICEERLYLASYNTCEVCSDHCKICINENKCQFCGERFYSDDSGNCSPCLINRCLEYSNAAICTKYEIEHI